MRITYLFLISLLMLSLHSSRTHAQEAATPDNATKSPLEISADTSLEWARDKKQYIATGRATAKQDNFSVTGDTLTADYRQGANGNSEIWQLTATGNVEIISKNESGDNKAYGDKAIYNVDDEKAVMTGKNIRLEGKDLKITASEQFEYYKSDNKMVAVGAPVVTYGKDTLKADKITAWLSPKETKKQPEQKPEKQKTQTDNVRANNLKRAEAEGHVVITTPDETATSNRAIYRGDSNTAEMLENVKIKRGPNILEGARAEIDLTTKISKIFGAENQNTTDDKNARVKGVFYPSSNTKK